MINDPNLSLFDGIIWFNFIKSIKAVFNTENYIIYFNGGQVKLKCFELDTVNALISDVCIPKLKNVIQRKITKIRDFLQHQMKPFHIIPKISAHN